MQRDDLLVWIDLEMTGLDPVSDRITEIATVVTDKDLNVIAEGPDTVIHLDEVLLNELISRNPFFDNQEFNLTEEVLASTTSLEEATQQTLGFVAEYMTPQSSPLCGNSIWNDRAFIRQQMPELDSYFHYRCIDVSSIKELARRWRPELFEQASKMKKERHRAKDDILESIEELKFYRDNFFKL